MKHPRRKFLHLAAGAAALLAMPRVARAQTYPARPVRIIAPFAAGLTPDIVARLIGQWLSEQLGQQFIIENRTGANGNIGTDAVVHAPADGYTLLLATSPNAINVALYDDLKFNFIRDIVPVASIVRAPLVMEVNPLVPATTVPEFITYARASSGKVNMASGGIGSPQHVAGELFKMMAGVDMLHVPYRGSPLPDLLGGQVQVYFGPIPASIGYIRTDKLHGLAVTGATRTEALPDIPTVAEFLPGYEASAWYGIGAPKDTPAEIVDKLNTGINAALADPKMQARLAELGAVPMPTTSADFGRFIAAETEKWAKVVKFSGAKPG